MLDTNKDTGEMLPVSVDITDLDKCLDSVSQLHIKNLYFKLDH